MKKNTRTPFTWAIIIAIVIAGTLVAQDADPIQKKTQLLIEALKAREEGSLALAQEKYEQILQIDDKDVGALEGRDAVKAAIDAAALEKKKAEDAAAPAPTPPAAPVVMAKPESALDAVVSDHQKLFAEVEAATAYANQLAKDGNFADALAKLDGAFSALPNTRAAQPYRDKISLAKQDIILRREAVNPSDELSRLRQITKTTFSNCDDAISKAQSLIRKGGAANLDEAISELDRADKALPENISSTTFKARIKEAKAGALARRALVAIEVREMSRADEKIREYEKLMGADDASARRLRAEFTAKKMNPTYRNVDDVSPGLRAKDDKVDELLVKGRARYLYGDYQGALEAYREVLQYQPNNSESKAYQVRIREILSENSGQWNRGVTKGKLLELLDETWKLPEVFNRESIKEGGVSTTDPVLEKLRSITLPELTIREMTLDRAIQQLNNAGQTYDKDQKGVNMVVMDPERKNPLIPNTSLRNLTLEKALEIITKQANFTFTISQGIVEIRPDSGSNDLETEFFSLNSGAEMKMTGMSAGGGAAGAAPAAGASPFGGAAGAGASAGGDGSPRNEALKSFLVRSGVPFEGVTGAQLNYDGTNLIVTQNRKNLDRVRNILRRYSDIKQVHIEAKFIEVAQNTLNELSTNFRLSTQVANISATTGLPDGTFTNTVRAQTNLRSLNSTFGSTSSARQGQIVDNGSLSGTISTTPIVNTAPIVPGAVNTGGTEPNFGGISGLNGATGTYNGMIGTMGSFDLSVFLRAVEQQSGTDLMSSPSLTVLDGKTAVIKVAQLLRYPQSYGDTQSQVASGTAATATTGSVSGSVAITAGTPQDFTVMEIGVSLEVTPTVGQDDSIALNLKPKVTEFEGFVEYGGTSIAIASGMTVSVPSGFFQPIFSTREVTTEVTVFDGATVVIGGLTREEVKTVNDKVPVLGDIPLIGAAFRSTGKTTTKRNLMIFITANLVSPGGATLRSSHPGMRAGTTFSNPTLTSPGGAVYREPIEAVTPTSSSAPSQPAAEPGK